MSWCAETLKIDLLAGRASPDAALTSATRRTMSILFASDTPRPTPKPIPAEVAASPRSHLRLLPADEKIPPSAFTFSPSAVATYRDCPRKWFYQNVLKIPTPEKESTQLGTACHTIWEGWLEAGATPPDSRAGKIARTTIKHLPAPGTVRIERWLRIETPFGVGRGRIDFDVSDQGAVVAAVRQAQKAAKLSISDVEALDGLVGFDLEDPVLGLDEILGHGTQAHVDAHGGVIDAVPLIGDHKTSANPSGYAKDAAILIGLGTREEPGDPQACFYGTGGLLENVAAKAVDLFWSYASTAPNGKPLPIRARMYEDALDKSLILLLEDVQEMRETFDAYKLSGVPGLEFAPSVYPEISSCSAYGGCSFQSKCSKTLAVLKSSIPATITVDNKKEESHMASELDAMLAQLNLGNKAAPAAAQTVAPTPTAPASSGSTLDEMMAKMKAAAAPAAVAPTPAVVAPTPAVVAPPPAAAPAVVRMPDIAPESATAIAKQFIDSGKAPPAEFPANVFAEFERMKAGLTVLPPDAPVAPLVQAAPVGQAAAPVIAPVVVAPAPAATPESRLTREEAPKKRPGRPTKEEAAKKEAERIAAGGAPVTPEDEAEKLVLEGVELLIDAKSFKRAGALLIALAG